MSYQSGTFLFLPLIIHRHVAVKKWLHEPTYPGLNHQPHTLLAAMHQAELFFYSTGGATSMIYIFRGGSFRNTALVLRQ
jgi:hypothetical protein